MPHVSRRVLLRLSPFRRHVEKWKDCTRCPLSQKRNHVVFARGDIPCDVLYVGEAPGDSEDTLASPFIGRSGKLLDRIIDKALEEYEGSLRMAFSNLVCCIPLDEDTPRSRKTRKPDPEEIKECRPRLIEFVRIAKPRIIVNVGGLSKKFFFGQFDLEPVDWLPQGQDFIYWTNITHPSAILQASPVVQSTIVDQSIAILSNIFDELKNPPPF